MVDEKVEGHGIQPCALVVSPHGPPRSHCCLGVVGCLRLLFAAAFSEIRLDAKTR
jgi:hypothetical protein